MQGKLPLPALSSCDFNGIVALSDDPLFDSAGVRIAFTSRQGGVSEGEFGALNLGNHVGDDPDAVKENRARVLHALGSSADDCIFANQLHGDRIVVVAKDADRAAVELARVEAKDEADGIVVGARGVSALLCFADCVPVIVVSPTGAFAVVHAGWRGVMARIAPKAVRMLASGDAGEGLSDPASFNVYIGPHIHAECFETSSDIRDSFTREFGDVVATGERHVDLLRALKVSLQEIGVSPERIVDSDICTKCDPEHYFSYRASGGVCGRHAAIAFRAR